MDITDGFLREKVSHALAQYLQYLRPALILFASGKVELGNREEAEILQRFASNGTRYQVRASTFVLEAFHAVELLLKALLARHGEHLLYEDFDDHIARRAKAIGKQLHAEAEFRKLCERIANPVSAGRNAPANLLEEFCRQVTNEPVEDFGKSVSAHTALRRLLHVSGKQLDQETMKRFYRLIEFRNQVVHFGDLRNLLRGVVDALNVLLSLCDWAQVEFPRLRRIRTRYQVHLKLHDELVQHLMLHEIMPRLVAAGTHMLPHLGPIERGQDT
jgi:hypothetical protein